MQSNPDQINRLGAFQDLERRGLMPALFDRTPLQIYGFDATSLRFFAANPAACRATGMSLAELRRKRPQDLLRPEAARRLERLLVRIRLRATPALSTTIQLDQRIGLRLDLTIVYHDGPAPSFLACLGRISQAYRSASNAFATLETAIEALSDGFVLYDNRDRLVICNQRYRDLYSESAPAMTPGRTFEEILRYGLDRGQYEDAIGQEEEWLARRLDAHRTCAAPVEQHLSGDRWLRIEERPTQDGGRVGLRVDITAIKHHQAELNRLAITDDLTGLLNRRGLMDRLDRMRAALLRGQDLMVMQIDLDRFKTVNDVWGHEAGDAVLTASARRLSRIIGPGGAISRVGGDEFVVARPCGGGTAFSADFARQIIEALSDPIPLRGQSVRVGASVGFDHCRTDDARTLSDVLASADIAISHAKQSGGGVAVAFRDAMREESRRVHLMAEDIQRGLAAGEFEPFYQPQIDTRSGRITGMEALVRWRHPERGLVPAFQFLDVAQKSGLADALDDVVVDRACEAAQTLRRWGMKGSRISINLSASQISDPHIVSRLHGHMAAHGVSSDDLRVELLESTLIDQRSTQTVRNVHALIEAGFPVELDDFGTGHAAIATLRQFAVSCIKIDRSLVQNIDSDPELQVITAAIIDLAHRLRIDVLAEGVETEAEQVQLQTMGCHRAQGYLHARPMPLSDLHDFLRDRRQVP